MTEAALDLPSPRPGETGPYTLVGTVRAKPGRAAALQARLTGLIGPTRSEPGVLAYEVHRDRADPELFVFYEAWSDVGALRRHLAQPYVQAFLRSRHDLIEGDLNVNWLGRLGSDIA